MKTPKKESRAKTPAMDGNLEVREGYALLALSPSVFPLPVVYAACRPFAEKAYFLIDGDPAEEIVVEFRSKAGKLDLLALGRDLGNTLVKELERFHQERLPAIPFEKPVHKEPSYLEDPLHIMKPWSEK
ncbi:hypothetical protein J4439_07180 [Candidatus Woesearchaeota archaeon]|nr:hypothetical protein [Candidatus Woesearchaeota archaeon]